MKDLDELMSMLNGFTATALGANISSDIHRAAQDNARMIFQEILRDSQKIDLYPGDEGVKMAARIGTVLARLVAQECAPILSPPRSKQETRVDGPDLAPDRGALTPEEFAEFLRNEEKS